MIRAEVDATAVLRRLGRAAQESRNRTVPNRQLGIQLYGWVLRNFQASGGMQRPPWAPLRPSTLAQKARQGYSSQPLIRTGHYRQSFRPFSDNDSAGVGSEVPYSRYHETGTSRMVQRAALPPAEVALDYAVRIYDRWVAGIARTG